MKRNIISSMLLFALSIVSVIGGPGSPSGGKRGPDHNQRNVRYSLSSSYNSQRGSTINRHVHRLPAGSVRLHHHGVPYNQYHGYKANASYGIRAMVLPAGYSRVVVGATTYYYCKGSYYRFDSRYNDYYSVAAPIGSVLAKLPQGYVRVTINGLTYYRHNETYYRAFVDETGQVLYEVIGV